MLRELPDPVPAPAELLVTVTAAGVNRADRSRIDGTYAAPPRLPFIPGSEIVGHTADGRRVAGVRLDGGGYATAAAFPSSTVVDVPPGVPDGVALALLVQGLTAWHALRSGARLGAGDGRTVAIGAAAGGVGSLAVQLARHFGAGRVLAVASTPEKRELALALGADAAAESYADLGERPDVILDASDFRGALAALAPFGTLVTYGDSAGAGLPPVDPSWLMDHNLAVAGFWLRPALRLTGAFQEPLSAMFGLFEAGILTPPPTTEYPLPDAARALDALLSRRTTGKLVLRP
ncbi:zinc-binding dehydrogenase [Dactylosporangium sp. NPDC005572]|uniref:quinone oxidoreductase family protein n=1 Tax=Dactylosporangium sp. NPDC005572 TaxID=3156889 RepID=UPI0033B7647F